MGRVSQPFLALGAAVLFASLFGYSLAAFVPVPASDSPGRWANCVVVGLGSVLHCAIVGRHLALAHDHSKTSRREV